MGEFVCENPPGICSQADFDHDAVVCMRYLKMLNHLAFDKHYLVKLSSKDIVELMIFLERAKEWRMIVETTI